LESLVSQEGVSFEIFVVDDHSTDHTARIARSFPRVQVLSAAPLPPGWIGKANAIQIAIPLARGRWFLFTDADTVHAPGSLGRSLAEAREHHVGLLSYSPRQETGSFWERAIQPVVFAELNRRFTYEDINRPDSEVAVANGQYILITRTLYEAIGGHAAVRGSLLEDVELGRLAKRVGKPRFRYGPDAVSARMYRGLQDLITGWTKNLAGLFPGALGLAGVRLLESLLLLGGPLAAVALLSDQRWLWGALAAVATVICYMGLVRRLRIAGWKLAECPWSVLGVPMLGYLLLRSYFMYRVRKKVTWKGRSIAAGPGG
jgi:cellulose synthase/poly-beta-1,6-N-acetylglucosamine synthase-like glycosyltransferase